jgi:formylglycine-generating enzyme
MGSNHHPEEAPAHQGSVEGFWMDKYAATNEQFAKFVDATSMPKANPRRSPKCCSPSGVFQKADRRVDQRNQCNPWTYVPGANWRHPEWPASSIDSGPQHGCPRSP